MISRCVSSWRVTLPEAQKSPLPLPEQKAQPSVPFVPSRFGQVKPPSTESFAALRPKR